jgi:Kef-type K+ transport system membrane component KefB
LGTLTLAAGSMDDGLAWCLLAIVLTGFSGNGALAAMAVGGGVLYAIVTLFPGRSLLKRLGHW